MIAAAVNAQAALLLSHWWSRPTDGERELWSECFQIGEHVANDLGGDPDLVGALADAVALIDGETMLSTRGCSSGRALRPANHTSRCGSAARADGMAAR
jgi:hypothetical protein